jgi:hypothetical protein
MVMFWTVFWACLLAQVVATLALVVPWAALNYYQRKRAEAIEAELDATLGRAHDDAFPTRRH